MAAKDRLIKAADIDVTVREIDFVTRFERNWEHLREIMGISRPIKKTPGTILRSKTATGSLQSGNVGEGEEIPYSKFTITETNYGPITIDKYAKAVSLESIKDYGYDVAVQMTDNAFLFELQQNVTDRFYTYLNTGALTSIETTFQMALAMAKGRVENKFKLMHRTITGVVGFVNVLDVYEYLGAASVTIQNQFGFQYIKDFMGYGTIFLLSEDEIARGKVIATAVENIVMYFVDPSESDFARAGLVYTTAGGETDLIGFHTQGNYTTAVSEEFAIVGLTLFAEYLDAIAVATVEASGSLGSLSGVSTAASTAATAVVGDCVVTITDTPVNGGTFWFKAASGTAPSAPTYKDVMSTTGWTQVKSGDVVNATNGYKYRVVALNGAGQAISTTDGTVTSKNS